MSDSDIKCSFCGGRRFILSTEKKGKNWICKRVCKNCNKVVSQSSIPG